MEDFMKMVGYLKGLADESNAGKAFVEWTFVDGGVLRLEYRPNKRREK